MLGQDKPSQKDQDEKASLTDGGTMFGRDQFVSRGAADAMMVDYFLNNDVYSCYPWGARVQRQMRNFFTCKKDGSFVSTLNVVHFGMMSEEEAQSYTA